MTRKKLWQKNKYPFIVSWLSIGIFFLLYSFVKYSTKLFLQSVKSLLSSIHSPIQWLSFEHLLHQGTVGNTKVLKRQLVLSVFLSSLSFLTWKEHFLKSFCCLAQIIFLYLPLFYSIHVYVASENLLKVTCRGGVCQRQKWLLTASQSRNLSMEILTGKKQMLQIRSGPQATMLVYNTLHSHSFVVI